MTSPRTQDSALHRLADAVTTSFAPSCGTCCSVGVGVGAGVGVGVGVADAPMPAPTSEKDSGDSSDPSPGAKGGKTPPTTSTLTWSSVARTWAVSLAMGAAFGFVVDRSSVSNPVVIRSQVVFARETMLKMFFSAVGSSSLSMSLLHAFWPDDFDKTRAGRGFGDKGMWTMLAGGLVQGVGMALTGACPGMVMVQLGAGQPDAGYVFAGGVLGALAYGLVHPALEPAHVHDFRSTFRRLRSGNLDEALVVASPGEDGDGESAGKRTAKRAFRGWAAAFGALALAAAAGLDAWHVSYVSDARGVPGARASPRDGLASPVLAGAVVGALQLPAFLALNTFLGSSSAYSVVASQYMRVAPDEHKSRFKYLASWLTSRAWWQWAYLVGAVAGGWLSSSGALDGRPAPPGLRGVGPVPAAVGGFLLVFGARVAGGCATGHGISGLSLFNVTGWTAVPAMFAGAILASALAAAAVGRDAFLLASGPGGVA